MMCSQRDRQHRRGGYVLVVALGLLVLSATVMVSITRAAVRHTAAARAARDELQRRYGSASLRAAVLPRAESILTIAEAVRHRELTSVRTRLRLGAMLFDVIVADEQAKANLNAVLARSAADAGASVESRLREALSGSGLGNQIHVRPAPPAEAAALAPVDRPQFLPKLVNGFGQVFDLTRTSPEQLLGTGRADVPAALDLITIWGDGRINLRRATTASARLALVPPLSAIDVDRLLAARTSKADTAGASDDPLAALLQRAAVPMSVAGGGVPVMLGSRCHSIWVICDDGRRRWTELEVSDTSEPQRPTRSYFAW